VPCSRAIQTLERLRFQSAARIGSCTVAFLRRGVPLPSDSGLRSLAGRLVLPSSPGGTHGVSGPSQSCSRHGWGDISAIPGPRAVRATHPSRFIFVGVILIVRSESHWNRNGRFWVWGKWRSTSGLRSRLRSAPAVVIATGRDPALGFASCRVADTYSCIRPGSSPNRITSLRAERFTRNCTIRSWALRILFESATSANATVPRLTRDGSSPPTSPALQRLEGLMPCHSERTTGSPAEAPCLRFCTFREEMIFYI